VLPRVYLLSNVPVRKMKECFVCKVCPAYLKCTEKKFKKKETKKAEKNTVQ